MVNKQLYANSFWSPNDESVDIFNAHFNSNIKTMESLLGFYKERIAIEEEYARKLNSLSKKSSSLYKNELGTLKNSLELLTKETKQLGVSHQNQAAKIHDEVFNSLEEFITRQKGETKHISNSFTKLLKYKLTMETKALVAKKKYETAWQRLNSCRTEQILMDNSEATRMQARMTKLSDSMSSYRAEYFTAVSNYNEIYKTWNQEWPEACHHYQRCDQEKIKFLRDNILEYSNAVSNSCLLDDQSCENIRLSLEKCSVSHDLKLFVDANETGTKIFSPLPFIDYAKGDIDFPREVQDVKVAKQAEISKCESHSSLKNQQKLELTEEEEAKFEFLNRREDTFKQLQREAELEENKHETNSYKSESSGSHVMSEISQMTADTAYSEHKTVSSNWRTAKTKSLLDSVQSDAPTVYSNPLGDSIQSTEISTKPLNIDTEPVKATKRASKSTQSLREYFASVNLGINNTTKFRDSMQEASPQTPSTLKEEVKSDSIFDAKKTIVDKTLQSDVLSSIPPPDEQLKSKQRTKSTRIFSSSSNNSRKASNTQLHKSKSVTTLKSSQLSANNLPLRSKEGFKVLKYTKAQYSYKADIEQELSFKKRDVLLVIHMQPDGWWFAENLNSGESGLAPSNYLVEI